MMTKDPSRQIPHPGSPLGERFRELYALLEMIGYDWEPRIPEQLLRLRKEPDAFSPWVRAFGLGLAVDREELLAEGMSTDLHEALRPLRLALSRCGSFFVPHNHWPAHPEDARNYVHLGQESLTLARLMRERLDGFVGKRVLDLGCGSGLHALEVASLCEETLGIDISPRAVEWAEASAAAQGCGNLRFHHGAIGTPGAEAAASDSAWDRAVFNPPMCVPEKEQRPHRDGGKLGIELPLLFLDFARRKLRPGGEVLALLTNPIVAGRSVLFERIPARDWETLEKIRLNDHFNQSIARKAGYEDLGIQRIELWFVRLRRK